MPALSQTGSSLVRLIKPGQGLGCSHAGYLPKTTVRMTPYLEAHRSPLYSVLGNSLESHPEGPVGVAGWNMVPETIPCTASEP